MKTITKAVYADAENTSVRITYGDGGESVVIQAADESTDHGKALKEWLAAGNTVAPFQSGEEAGDKDNAE